MRKRMTAADFSAVKASNGKITVLTAYDYTSATLVEEAGIDVILVGDSLGMVILGYENTLQVTMEDMLHHTRAVSRGSGELHGHCRYALPVLSHQHRGSRAQRRPLRPGSGGPCGEAGGREGGGPADCGHPEAQIPVLGHLGLTPQSVHRMGGFKVQGKDEAMAREMVEEALLLQELGVCGIVLERVPAALATHISRKLTIPTIVSGQVAAATARSWCFRICWGSTGASRPNS